MAESALPDTVSFDRLIEAAAAGETVVTGNRRLARQLLQQYERARLAAGERVWETPVIVPWDAWLDDLWETAQFEGHLPPLLRLSPEQEQHLWAQVVADSPAGDRLLRPAATARLAAEAYALLHGWRLRLPDDDALNEDARAFRDWCIEFDFRCEEHGWLPGCRLAGTLAQSPTALERFASLPFWFVGFEELTPAQQDLLAAIEKAGGHWRWVQPEAASGQARRIGLADAAEEADRMARWVRHRLEADPAARIGVVVPDLASRRLEICRALDRILVPARRREDTDPRQRPYNVTLGEPLADVPLVHVALQLLRLATGPQPLEAVAGLLRSPFLAGWGEEGGARALLDRQLRETGEPHLNLARLRWHAARSDRPWHCPELVQRLDAVVTMLREWPRQAPPGEWVERFAAFLQAVGWAQGRPLSSPEHQAHEAWRRLLATLGSLETVGGRMAAAAALGQLQAMAAARLFQPQSPPAAVQVMGLYEAIGARFDHLWVMGMGDDAWPPVPRPNPFLPLSLQRRHGLPHASEARELAVARRITRRLAESAGEVIFSHVLAEEEEACRPSPLIAELPVLDPAELAGWADADWADRIRTAARLETVADRPPPPVPPGPVRGGSAMPRLQSLCPFRAFAELRLGATPFGAVGIGIDAMTRGTLVHRVLELLWNALGDQAALAALEDDALDAQVRLAVEQAVEEEANHQPRIFTAAFRRVESERLIRLVREWLDQERQRPPFRVEQTEQRVEAELEGLQIRLRIDRIDRLEDGRRVVIDYKTGTVSPGAWFGERPEDPQLPLYATLLPDDLAGVAFAQLRPGDLGFRGVAAEADLVPGTKWPEKLQRYHEGDWPELLEHWRETVHRLVRDFRDGQSDVDPKRYPDTCTWCELAGLCRIVEIDAGLYLEAEGDDD